MLDNMGFDCRLKPNIFAVLVEPANYTLDLIKNVYEPRRVEFAFIKGNSQASAVESHTLSGICALWRRLKAHDAVIINGYTGALCLIAIWLNILFFKKPMALDSDTELRIPANKVKRLAKRAWLHFLFTRKYCYGFAGGNYGHKQLFRYYGMAEERIFLMPMMVDNDKYKRDLPDSPHNPFRFGYLGRLVSHKQIDKVIEALPEGCELHIVGNGEDRLKLEAMANGKKVVFHGKAFGDEKIKLLHSLDCLVLYSSYEPWGLVVNEALASGIPVIVSDKVGAKKDLVEGSRPTGIVVPTDDTSTLAVAMQEMATQADLWKGFSKNAVARMMNWDYKLYVRNFDSWVKTGCK